MANHNIDDIVERLNTRTEYVDTFSKIYNTPSILYTQVTDVLATFQKHLERPSRFDMFMSGNRSRLTDQQLWGLNLFRGKAGCANCHYGPLLTDEKFHNLGLSFFGRTSQDLGRYEVTDVNEDVGRFRTPSLRHISDTAPYMHNGSIPQLRDVVVFYNRGGGSSHARDAVTKASPLFPFASTNSDLLEPLRLNRKEIEALQAFLESL